MHLMSARMQNATIIAAMHQLEEAAISEKAAVLDEGILADAVDIANVKARCELFKGK